jgi:hypothetical protein
MVLQNHIYTIFSDILGIESPAFKGALVHEVKAPQLPLSYEKGIRN